MGCDIHLNVLTKQEGKWAIETPPEVPGAIRDYPKYKSLHHQWPGHHRNYVQFGIMVGGCVRYDEAKITFQSPRGWVGISKSLGIDIPGKAKRTGCWDPPPWDEETWYGKGAEWWNFGEHSFTYLTLPDFEDFQRRGGWDQELPGVLDKTWISNLRELEGHMLRLMREGAEDVILLFSFDS